MTTLSIRGGVNREYFVRISNTKVHIYHFVQHSGKSVLKQHISTYRVRVINFLQ